MSSNLFDNRPKKQKLNRLPDNPEPKGIGRFPSWLHRKLPSGSALAQTNKILKSHGLNTVCEEAKCPNRLECYSKHTATFLALGKACTRACGFCDIDFAKTPLPPEKDEPLRIANSAAELGLKHIVITMVARDDLPDQGASHIAAIISAVRDKISDSTLEVLTSDFSGDHKSLNLVIDAKPEIFNHNIETVRRLTPRIRHKATYERTLDVLRYVKGKVPFLKSGIMVGLGEDPAEVKETILDLYQAGVDIITIGQYLQPNHQKLTVKSFISPDQFKQYEDYGHEIGIKRMYAGPFVRSSYNAHLIKNQAFQKKSSYGTSSNPCC
jgi:lipoic acid synthetase